MQEVIVVNKHPFPVSDGYIGMKWTFEPGQKVTIPLAAAVHIFGHGIKDPERLSSVYRRFGKNVTDGQKFIENFNFTDVELVQQEVVDEADHLKIALEDASGKLDEARKELLAQAKQLDDAASIMKSQQDQIAELNAQIEQLTKQS
jgi:hypothetical protein